MMTHCVVTVNLENVCYSFPPAMAKFSWGAPSVLCCFLATDVSLLGLEGRDQTFLRGLLKEWEGLFTGLLVAGHHL